MQQEATHCSGCRSVTAMASENALQDPSASEFLFYFDLFLIIILKMNPARLSSDVTQEVRLMCARLSCRSGRCHVVSVVPVRLVRLVLKSR
jgi:hypothetical protein